MEMKKLEAAIEAILFTMGDSVELEKIAQAIDKDIETTKNIIDNMMERYNKEESGIKLIELEQSYQLCTKQEYYEYITKIATQPQKYILSDVLLETLSIIAYRQPITKPEIDKIRGVKCDHAVNKLVEYNLVCEVGRLDAPGRPLMFGTTEEFLRAFGVTSIGELPKIDEEQLEDFKMQAEEEVQMTLNV